MPDTILIVDDDRQTRTLLSKGILKHFPDMQVSTAENGRKALEQIQINDASLVITDLMMPVMDGFELITQLMAHYPDIPVLVITGNPIPEKEQRRFKEGSLVVLSKPFKVETLCDHVTQILKNYTDGGILHNTAPSMFLQLVELEAKTCTIRVLENQSGKQGVLFFSKGQLLDARMAQLQGEEAARQIAAWDTTSLVIQNKCPVKTARIQKSVSALLLDAARIKDEANDANDNPPVTASALSVEPEAAVANDPAVPQALLQRIEQNQALVPHLRQIQVEPEWQPLLSQLSMFKDYFQTGSLKSVSIGTGLADDIIVIPINPPIALRIDPRYPKDKVLALIEGI
ncbi:response regulator receiver protein [Desulfosarcina variabilis str. Montpellier]|uniref:response regulator n=1 Tax=Desulfosarcina variabilis TaxID=2300 RepID=UPI003AFA49E3